MTTATDRRAGPPGSAVRCAWAVLVALLAALAVLIHHDTTSTAMPARAMSVMAGMDHTSAAMAMTTTAASTSHGTALQAANTAMDADGGACSGPGMQHCSAGDVSTAKLAPPPAAAHVGRADISYGVLSGRGLLGASHRAPPDLSVLSRLLI
ncbi:hypothetical protein ACFY1J_42125 [Streptomyces sp. NPDC001406]|uniref:hypothetical protein n=1 Tax=Streptomyces sp. NPDC001406 TaxID=3364572 RepID=UPI0036A15EFC